MATDFFAQQDAARRKTGLLVFYFAVACALIVVAVYAVIASAFIVGRQHVEGYSAPPASLLDFLDPRLFVSVAAGTLTVIAGGSVYKTASLNAGGESVARQLGGRRLRPDTTDPYERRLLNVVEEMALASGTPVPTIFILDNEPGINAFAAGYTPGDAVIGVTRGTLDYLDRDELQGVTAHEFSHILNGDMRLNIRLIGLLHGILFLATIGYVLVRTTGRSSHSSRRARGSGAGAILLIGAGLIAIGYIGVFFGRLIKSAVSRQREFLADASAVQFTRNPDGIGGALKKIGGLQYGSRIKDGHAEEASHMFFGNALRQSAFSLMATHPPLEVRIKRIDPSFDGKFPRVEPRRIRPEGSEAAGPPAAEPFGPFARPGTAMFDSLAALATIGAVEQQHLEYARAMLASIPGEVRAGIHDPQGAQATIYRLLLSDEPSVRRLQEDWLAQHAPAEVRGRIDELARPMAGLPAAARVPLVEMAFPALRELDAGEYADFRKNVEALVRADRRLALFEYTLRRMLLRHLDAHFEGKKPVVVQYYALRGVLGECAALLSALAHVGHRDPAAAARAFQAGARLLEEGVPLTMLSREQCNLDAVDEALAKLALTSPAIKKRVLTAALACAAADRQVTVAEGELLRAIADALDCPMPPLLSPPAEAASA